MSKPEDLSDSAWEAAEHAFYGCAPNAMGAIEAIARAIMAAKAEEREACWNTVAFLELEADDAAPADYRDGYEAAVNEFSVFAAAAIRKRGEG